MNLPTPEEPQLFKTCIEIVARTPFQLWAKVLLIVAFASSGTSAGFDYLKQSIAPSPQTIQLKQFQRVTDVLQNLQESQKSLMQNLSNQQTTITSHDRLIVRLQTNQEIIIRELGKLSDKMDK